MVDTSYASSLVSCTRHCRAAFQNHSTSPPTLCRPHSERQSVPSRTKAPRYMCFCGGVTFPATSSSETGTSPPWPENHVSECPCPVSSYSGDKGLGLWDFKPPTGGWFIGVHQGLCMIKPFILTRYLTFSPARNIIPRSGLPWLRRTRMFLKNHHRVFPISYPLFL